MRWRWRARRGSGRRTRRTRRLPLAKARILSIPHHRFGQGKVPGRWGRECRLGTAEPLRASSRRVASARVSRGHGLRPRAGGEEGDALLARRGYAVVRVPPLTRRGRGCSSNSQSLRARRDSLRRRAVTQRGSLLREVSSTGSSSSSCFLRACACTGACGERSFPFTPFFDSVPPARAASRASWHVGEFDDQGTRETHPSPWNCTTLVQMAWSPSLAQNVRHLREPSVATVAHFNEANTRRTFMLRAGPDTIVNSPLPLSTAPPPQHVESRKTQRRAWTPTRANEVPSRPRLRPRPGRWRSSRGHSNTRPEVWGASSRPRTRSSCDATTSLCWWGAALSLLSRSRSRSLSRSLSALHKRAK